jgi:hypothetical protein
MQGKTRKKKESRKKGKGREGERKRKESLPHVGQGETRCDPVALA